MDGGFSADPDALRGQARDFLGESDNLAQLANSLGRNSVSTGDGGLDALIARLVDEVKASVGGAGMSVEADGAGLMASAQNYEAADQASRANPSEADGLPR